MDIEVAAGIPYLKQDIRGATRVILVESAGGLPAASATTHCQAAVVRAVAQQGVANKLLHS